MLEQQLGRAGQVDLPLAGRHRQPEDAPRVLLADPVGEAARLVAERAEATLNRLLAPTQEERP